MRFRRGSIEISPVHDEPILRTVLRAGYLSHEQLLGFLQLGPGSCLLPSFNWRVRRLVQHGLLVTNETPILARTRIYSVGDLGVEYLAGRGEFCAVPIHGRAREPACTSVLHALDLNEIQLALRDSGVLVQWRPEPQIRSRNELTSSGYAKDYDAVVRVYVGTVESEFALEYERTPKAKRRYEFVRYKVEQEVQLPRFVFVAANYHLLNYLARMFTGTRRPVYFGLLGDILQRQLDMAVLDSSSTRREPLRNVLLR
jgi:hypothetical protein